MDSFLKTAAICDHRSFLSFVVDQYNFITNNIKVTVLIVKDQLYSKEWTFLSCLSVMYVQ